MVYYYKSEFYTEKLVCCLQGQYDSKGLNLFGKWQFLLFIFWTADHFAVKLGLVVHSHVMECHVKKMDQCVQGKGQRETSKWWWVFSGQWLLTYGIFYYQTWYSDVSLWAGVKETHCCLQGQGHGEDSQLWLSAMTFCYQTWFDGISWIVSLKD